ncbi:3277_t:CDS:2, partial [Acaulospora colombiana]
MSPTRTHDNDLERIVDGRNFSGMTNGSGLNITAAKPTVAVTTVNPDKHNIVATVLEGENFSGTSDAFVLCSLSVRFGPKSHRPLQRIVCFLTRCAIVMTLHQAAQQGNLHIVKCMLESGQAKANDRDSQNTTPLHWAAINNHVEVAKLLIDNGAEVDSLGGDLVATPLHWAARNGHLPVVTLLINHGADPKIRDSQGFNGLHLATHSSNSMLILYLIYQDMDIDIPDTLQHTPLMWAAYQGDATSVDLFIRLGASPNSVDSAQFTPLHWAVIKGNSLCIRKLIEGGADINAKEENGKTTFDLSREMKSDRILEKALIESGRRKDGKRRPYLFEKGAVARRDDENSLFHKFISSERILGRAHLDAQNFAWYSRFILTSYLFIANITFVTSYLVAMYSFYTAVLADPGFVSKLRSREDQKKLITDLANKGMLDARHLCITCLEYLQNEFVIIPPVDFMISAPEYAPTPSETCLLNSTLCGFFHYDSWTAVLCIWIGLQLTWTIGLLCMQSFQIASAKTTNEMANFHRYSYFGNRTGGNVREQIMATLAAGPGASGAAQVGDNSNGDGVDGFGDHAPRGNHGHASGLLRMFGGREGTNRRNS